MKLDDMLTALNDRAPEHRFGELQDIRKERRPLQKLPSRRPFRSTKKNWAHHVGGREELQFNIGDDEGMLRWGVAISLQPSRSLPDVSDLFPKLRKLGAMLEMHGDHLQRLGFELWDWQWDRIGGRRTRNRAPRRIEEDLYRQGVFVFVGKRGPFEAFDADRILRDFDKLLPVYEFVEFESGEAPPALNARRGFVFEPGRPAPADRARETERLGTPGVSKLSLRHVTVQDALKSELEREGAAVSIENPDGRGGYIDLVSCRDGEYEFYEIKTDTAARLAIRHAIGQLLEYAYWPPLARPKRLVVVAEPPLDAEAADYLRTLEAETGLAIGYRQVKPEG